MSQLTIKSSLLFIVKKAAFQEIYKKSTQTTVYYVIFYISLIYRINAQKELLQKTPTDELKTFSVHPLMLCLLRIKHACKSICTYGLIY